MSEQESALKEAVTSRHIHAVEQALDAQVPTQWTAKSINLADLRIATQARELVIQGYTLNSTFKEFNEVWLSLHTEDKKCIIVDQVATKLKYQLVNLYAIKLVKYLNSIIGLDLVPLAQQDPATRTWKMDAVILNIASNKITDHEHLFRLMLVNLFGISEDIVDFSLAPTYGKLRNYLSKTYGWVQPLEPAAADDAVPTIEALSSTVVVCATQGKLTIG
ncbi:hypothetical protein OBP_284 [Pseudomonas phage OBP]|uniref:hypothetical protein n=1 Tax=Pseudomonas phage OBP TaxID=1124849 RepID=UPI000240D637|nr:hypothetical protein OBP_284 [Pseudomonas phage OBP]AEV89721.1 hypothetical protein OBP_284 [Pseudomonas phage OBP]